MSILLRLALLASAWVLLLPASSQAMSGGSFAPEDSHPYMVSLGNYLDLGDGMKWSHSCSGSLIAPGYVLTAAHCINWPEAKPPEDGTEVRFGNLPGKPTIKIKRAAVSYNYINDHSNLPSSDLALVELQSPAPTEPVELSAFSSQMIGSPAVLLGYGRSYKKPSSEDLQQGGALISPSDQCGLDPFYGPQVFPSEKTEICAKASPGQNLNSAGCRGDSGGALLFDNKLLGVTSWVPDRSYCGGPMSTRKTVFARADALERWMRTQTGEPLFGLPALPQELQAPEGVKAKLKINQAGRVTATAKASGSDWQAFVGVVVSGFSKRSCEPGKRSSFYMGAVRLSAQRPRVSLIIPKGSWRKLQVGGQAAFYNQLKNRTSLWPLGNSLAITDEWYGCMPEKYQGP